MPLPLDVHVRDHALAAREVLEGLPRIVLGVPVHPLHLVLRDGAVGDLPRKANFQKVGHYFPTVTFSRRPVTTSSLVNSQLTTLLTALSF